MMCLRLQESHFSVVFVDENVAESVLFLVTTSRCLIGRSRLFSVIRLLVWIQ